ncbi:MAG: hypothetical protein GXY86_04110 [Firmicutes bacterium]|nr:hypothetical protein [Bacillota bacterium]
MKKACLVLSVLILLSVFSCLPAEGCTSFAEYSDTILYGMNFDFIPNTELKFVVDKSGDGKVFLMRSQIGDTFIETIGMNDKGLFAAFMMQFPEQMGKSILAENEITTWDLFMMSRSCERCQQIMDFLKNRRLVHIDLTTHLFFGDQYGDSTIIEVGDDDNVIIPMEGQFNVMTNFSNTGFIGKPYTEVIGAGDDRYKTAYEHIQKNINNFSVETGLETLALTQQSDGTFPTLCSMIFDPENKEVYIVLNRGFSKVWKLSMEKETIESFKGFDKPITVKMKPEGILASELIKFGAEALATSQ